MAGEHRFSQSQRSVTPQGLTWQEPVYSDIGGAMIDPFDLKMMEEAIEQARQSTSPNPNDPKVAKPRRWWRNEHVSLIHAHQCL